MKVGDRLFCIKDNVEFVYSSCCYNRMGSSAPSVMGSKEEPISVKEAESLGKVNRGTSYWFKFHTKNRIYEVTDIFRNVNVHLTCNKMGETSMTMEEIPDYFLIMEDI